MDWPSGALYREMKHGISLLTILGSIISFTPVNHILRFRGSAPTRYIFHSQKLTTNNIRKV